MLLLGAIRPRMLRGTTLDARRRPCKLLVGGEVPATCHAKACALGVQQLELAFLLVPRHCPALSHPPKAQSQNICSWGLHKEALIDLGPLRGTTAPRPPGQLLPCRVEKGLCFVSLPCFPSRAEGQCGSPHGLDEVGEGAVPTLKGWNHSGPEKVCCFGPSSRPTAFPFW